MNNAYLSIYRCDSCQYCIIIVSNTTLNKDQTYPTANAVGKTDIDVLEH